MNASRCLIIAALLLGLLLAAGGLATAAAGGQIVWWVAAGGGGGASAGAYQMGGTAGQPAAGLVAGGDYVLGSGFWGGGQVTGAAGGIYLPLIVR